MLFEFHCHLWHGGRGVCLACVAFYYYMINQFWCCFGDQGNVSFLVLEQILEYCNSFVVSTQIILFSKMLNFKKKTFSSKNKIL